MANVTTGGKTHAGRTMELGVDNLGFFLDRMGAECGPTQLIRELTVNGIQAIQALGLGTSGQVIWDYAGDDLVDALLSLSTEEERAALSGSIYKLCIIDTGTGMTGQEMVQYINNLACTGRIQAEDQNFGVGAKIAAATRNPAGMVYLSWKNGVGSMIWLWKDPASGQYGLRPLQLPDGTTFHWAPINDEYKPSEIGDHGTMVILLGQEPETNTMEPPAGVDLGHGEANVRNRWIARYLNSRFYKFPDEVQILAREAWDSNTGSKRRRVMGSSEFLERNQESSGSVDLGDVQAHWWILQEKEDRNWAFGRHMHLSGGHMAALYQDELYELATKRSADARLQSFGIALGKRRVVIYVEPKLVEGRKVTPNVSRTSLHIDGEALPWADWGERFRENMPAELVALQENVGNKDEGDDYKKSIRERLKNLMDILMIGRFRPAKKGEYLISETADVDTAGIGKGEKGDKERTKQPRPNKPKEGGKPKGLFSNLPTKEGGRPGRMIADPPELDVRWVAETEFSIADRAAHFVPETRTLLVNKEFRVYREFVEHMSEGWKDVPGAQMIIANTAKEWFEQQLIEAVLSAECFRGSKEWTDADMQGLLSDEALTAVVLPRGHIFNRVKQVLATNLGRARAEV